MTDETLRMEEVDLGSTLLDAVVSLYSAAKTRLGPFPKGAFEDHARQGKILGAIASDGTLAGYLLYRVAKSATKNRASIVHLTSHNDFRNQGVGRLLVDHLKQRTKHLLGISLRCRRDYNMARVWQSYDFTVRHSKAGRGADGALLDYWWFDHGHGDLFSQAAEETEAVATVIDANVFYDLTCDGRPHAEDTRVLQADWLQGSIRLCITREIYNEIHRCPIEAEKTLGRIAAQQFRELKTDETTIRSLEAKLAPLFKRVNTA
jgi:GNAT superfamily N-acetyltransferase